MEVLRACWYIVSWSHLKARLGTAFLENELSAAAKSLIELGFLIEEGAEFLALPLRQPG